MYRCTTCHRLSQKSLRLSYYVYIRINEMSALHLIKTYCLPSLLYRCEVWHLNDSNLHKISVAWNNCFRSIFSCCWRHSVKPLQYFCRTLPMSYLIQQRKLFFVVEKKTLYCSDNVVLQSLSHLVYNAFIALGSLYDVLSPKLSDDSVRGLMLASICHIC